MSVSNGLLGATDELGPDKFLFGTEESHGYVIGEYSRAEDGAVACLLMAELAADLKAKKISMHEYLDGLLIKHGCHTEDLLNVQMEGSEGMTLMKQLMAAFRANPPTTLGGIPVFAIRDYEALTQTTIDGKSAKLVAPKGNMVILDLVETGNYVAVRPSGTEPKVKFYFFTALTPGSRPTESGQKRY